MKGYKSTAMKICGMTRQEDVTVAVSLGFDLIGFIFHPSSPRVVLPEFVAGIDTGPAMRVGVFVDQSLEEVQEIMRLARLHVAQLHGDQDIEFCKALGKQHVIRTFWPERYPNRLALETEMDRFAPYCRFFLLDAGTSGGGHGTSIDVELLRELRSPKPYFLAGGLNPENLRGIVRELTPCGVDVNTGVESAPGIKDHKLMEQAMEAVTVRRSLLE